MVGQYGQGAELEFRPPKDCHHKGHVNVIAQTICGFLLSDEPIKAKGEDRCEAHSMLIRPSHHIPYVFIRPQANSIWQVPYAVANHARLVPSANSLSSKSVVFFWIKWRVDNIPEASAICNVIKRGPCVYEHAIIKAGSGSFVFVWCLKIELSESNCVSWHGQWQYCARECCFSVCSSTQTKGGRRLSTYTFGTPSNGDTHTLTHSLRELIYAQQCEISSLSLIALGRELFISWNVPPGVSLHRWLHMG